MAVIVPLSRLLRVSQQPALSPLIPTSRRRPRHDWPALIGLAVLLVLAALILVLAHWLGEPLIGAL